MNGGPLEFHSVGLYNLAVAHVTLDQPKEARSILLRVVQVDEKHWKAMSMLGNYDINEENWLSGKNYLEKARGCSNQANIDFSVHFNLGFCYLHLNDSIKALKHFEIAHSIDPVDPKGIQAMDLLSGDRYLKKKKGDGDGEGEGKRVDVTAKETTGSAETGETKGGCEVENEKDDDEETSLSLWEWYYLDHEENNCGPYPKKEMKQYFIDGFIGVNTMVWAEELPGGWSKLSSVPELSSLISRPGGGGGGGGGRRKPSLRRKKSVVKEHNLEEAKKLLKVSRPQYMKRHASMEGIDFGNTKSLMLKFGGK